MSLDSLLQQRLELVKKVALVKGQQGMPALDQKRFNTLLSRLLKKAELMDLDLNKVTDYYHHIHQESLAVESQILGHSSNIQTPNELNLEALRTQIDEVDDQILSALKMNPEALNRS